MATSPTRPSNVLLSDVGRRPATSTAAGSAKASGNDNGSSFSSALRNAQTEKSPQPAVSKTEKKSVAAENQPVTETRKPAGKDVSVAAGDDDAVPAAELPSISVSKNANSDAIDAETLLQQASERRGLLPSVAGKELPLGGSDLPSKDELRNSTDLIVGAEVNNAGDASGQRLPVMTRRKDEESETDAGGAAVLPTGLVTAAVLPETPASAAAAALATRSPQSASGESTGSDVTDVANAPKREKPASPQALNSVAMPDELSESNSAAPINRFALPIPASGKAFTAATQSDAADVDAALVQGAQAVAEGFRPLRSEKLNAGAVDATASRSAEIKGVVADTSQLSTQLSKQFATQPSTQFVAQKTEGKAADFGDVLKTVDNSLSGPAPVATDGAGSVTTARDAGVRQYMDASAVTVRVDIPVGRPGWSDAVADKVMQMSAQNLSSAEMHLNPPDLGPLSVRVSTHSDQASVLFSSPHAAVRDALDQSLPRLRELMNGQGLQLLDVGVGNQGFFSQQQAQQQAQRYAPKAGLFDVADSGVDSSVSVIRATAAQRPGLLDAYA